MIGQRIGRLVVVKEIAPIYVGIKKRTKRRAFECLCDCGKTTTASQNTLGTGAKQSCGCLRSESAKAGRLSARKNWTGKRFEYLTVLGLTRADNRGRVKWLCRCDCGAETWVAARGLDGLMAKSCGCKKGELVAEQKTTHGLSRRGVPTQSYELYQSMTGRAKKLNLPCDFLGDPLGFSVWFSDRLVMLGNMCPVLGTEFVRGSGRWTDASPTIDRLRPEAGYVLGNIEVISHRANQIKNDASLAEIEAVAAYLRVRGIA